MTLSRLLSVTAVALLLLVADAAIALGGTFEVVACDQSVAGGANNSFAAYADAGMTAYSDCRPFGEGMVARNVYDNGATPRGNRAAMIFDAPPGTVIQGLRFDGAIDRHNCSYSTILAAGGYDFGGQAIWGYGSGTQCGYPTAETGTAFNFVGQSLGLFANRVRLETQCVAAGCSRNGRSGVRVRNTRVVVRDDSAPVISSLRGGLLGPGWIGGDQTIGLSASDNSGVRDLRVLADGRAVLARGVPCDYTQRVPCPTSGDLERGVATGELGPDGNHQLRFVATDAAGNDSAVSRDVLIDNTAPDAPADAGVAGNDAWRATNAFDLSWSNPPQQHAPIGSATYELCRTSGQDCVTRTVEGLDIQRIPGLQVPAAGEWRLKVWLGDTAGNQDRRLVAPPLLLRFDDTSPEPLLRPLSADAPTELVVDTRDTGSGLAGGTVELRRAGSQRWRSQQVRVDGDRLVASIADERLLDGVYDVRTRVVDRAGNERSTDRWADGASARITMPIRLKTSLRAGIRRGRGTRTRLARAAYVAYGRRVRVRGRLTTPEGNPLGGVAVEATTDVKDSVLGPRLIATVRTSRSGAFSFLVRKGPSRTVTVRYAGAAKVRSATRVLQLNVRSRTSIRPDRHRLVNGETVRLRGRIATGRIPTPGKLVELQVFIRGRWRTFATTRSGRRGSWQYDYRFDGTRGSQSYRFRARIPRESGYPFATGRSRATVVRVRGT